MKKITEAQIQKGTRVLVRCDLDVIDNGKVVSTFRPEQSIETLNYIISQGGFPVICGHVQQPKGIFDPLLSTKPLEEFFNEKLGNGNYELLENLRFNAGEEENSEEFSQELAKKADLYVNESFATSHRKHASIVGVAKLLPAYAGINLAKEVSVLDKVISEPNRPLVAIIGGAKLESKKPVISKFLEIADKVLVGGKLGLEWQEEIPENLVLPKDYAGDDKDIGIETIATFSEIIKTANTIVWAGPLGMYEEPAYESGTREIARAVAEATNRGAFSLIGGGNTIEALEKFELVEQVSFVSTGGGAMLKYVSEGTLAGIDSLK